MKVSELVGLPIEMGAAIRRRRLFHPVGALAHGSMRRLAPPGEGPQLTLCEVVGRVSKGAGLPRGLPDVVGLAWRMPPPSSVFAPWDVLLASPGAGTRSRCRVRPVISWSGVTLSSLMPLRCQDRNWWISARLVAALGKRGVRLGDVAAHISRGGMHFVIDQTCGTGEFRPLACLELTQLVPPNGHDIAFDPMTHRHTDVTLLPSRLTDPRRNAYQCSRQGRDRSSVLSSRV